MARWLKSSKWRSVTLINYWQRREILVRVSGAFNFLINECSDDYLSPPMPSNMLLKSWVFITTSISLAANL